jgi:hypothetical protein
MELFAGMCLYLFGISLLLFSFGQITIVLVMAAQLHDDNWDLGIAFSGFACSLLIYASGIVCMTATVRAMEYSDKFMICAPGYKTIRDLKKISRLLIIYS